MDQWGGPMMSETLSREHIVLPDTAQKNCFSIWLFWVIFVQNVMLQDVKIFQLGWSFTTSLKHKVAIWWGFFILTAPAAVPGHVGADSLQKPDHIATLWFSKVVNDHPNYDTLWVQ